MSCSHANDRVYSQHADAHVGYVHRAALAAIAAGGLTVKFRHHSMYFNALGDAVSVAAMCGCDPVCRFERSAYADCAGFLAGIVMHRAERYAGFNEPLQTLLEFTDQRQALVHPKQLLARR